MFKRSRRRIVAAIMSVLLLLFLGTLTIIYGSSYLEVSADNHKMLMRYAEQFSLENQPGSDPLADSVHVGTSGTDSDRGPQGEEGENAAFQLSTFYSIAMSDNGEILASDTGDGTVYEESTLGRYAAEILESEKERGVKENLLFLIEKKDGYTLVAFMDNTIMQESMTTLFRNTLLFGSVAIVALFFLSVYLARRIVQPLEESYKKQKQFISDAGHELKTPVSVVNANAELLSRQIGDNQWLSNIQYENERMGKLVGQLLELARTEDVELQTERLDLSRLVGGEALPFESIAFEKGLELNCDITEGVFVSGSSDKLKQLVAILLDNAVSYTTGGTEISLRLWEERGSAKLSVVNDGPPLSEEQKRRLFERFYRINAARNGADGHYGLGLAIAKAIVAAHRGRIEALCYQGKVEFVISIPSQK